jgi:solute:Na+ symporter, SSS family
MFGRAKPDDDLQGLVRGVGATDLSAGELVGDSSWYRNPIVLGAVALTISFLLYIPFW